MSIVFVGIRIVWRIIWRVIIIDVGWGVIIWIWVIGVCIGDGVCCNWC